ncbi:ABC-2 family transporter protein [Paenibacillus sophorae]|uniref:ABC transporter permease n=1 Tax=Paenibacillus sophorae TaxID=1333845 RepID=A0A1H8TF86_9BACL|nr:ABC transporter permease [Paenibacillus sophorae]QWU16171.1 ABC transporter permease [Paenibacillus sophorae]SEO89495.1 ABC-2 family transporter protein [Paenibacillus sophorae]
MLNLIQADLFKLHKSKAIKILLGITTLSAVAMAVMAYLIPQGKIEASMTGIGFLFSDINMISILGGVLAGLYICSDFDNKTIHDAIANGCSRGAVILSKATVLGLALAFILLPYAIITGIALSTGSEFSMGSVAVGFLHVLTSGEGTAFSAAGIWKLLAVTLTLIIVYAAQLSICVPLAFVLKKPIFVVAINYGFSIISAQLIKLSESSPVFDRIFSSTPYGGNYAFVTLDTGTGDMVRAIAVSLIFIIVMLAVTYSAFRKSEIK